MATVTTKHALPRPSAGDPADGPANFTRLTDALDPLIATQASGTTAARPAFGKAGRLYWNTDTASLEYDTGTAWAPLRPVTALVPTLPTTGLYDGQIAYYQTATMASQGVVWAFRYRLGGGTYKWEFIGGPPLRAASSGRALYQFTGASYVAPTSAISLTLPPLEGDYDVVQESLFGQAADYINSVLVSYNVGAITAQASLDTWSLQTAFGNTVVSGSKTWRHAAVASGAILAERVRNNIAGSPGGNLYDTRIMATPVRVK